MNVPTMRKILYSLLLLLLIVPSAVQARRYTVVVSLDGFRRDYVQIYDTPFLNRMAREGVQATMQPSFPSVTFPNHYTLATGLYPDHHGIIANSFTDKKSGLRFSLSDKQTKQDPRFWRGEPVCRRPSGRGYGRAWSTGRVPMWPSTAVILLTIRTMSRSRCSRLRPGWTACWSCCVCPRRSGPRS